MQSQTNNASQPPRILVMEDDLALVELYSEVLKMEGFVVDGATTLDQARQLLDAHHYAVFICDMNIGNRRSTDLLREVLPHLKETHVVMLSGTGQYQTMVDEIGVDFFLAKPVDIDALIALMKRLSANG